MERDILVKRTAIATARVQAAAIRLTEARPDISEDLHARIRAPYGKREARTCNLMEAVAEVLDIVAPVAVVEAAPVVDAPVAVEADLVVDELVVEATAETITDPVPNPTPEAPTPRTVEAPRTTKTSRR